MQPTHNTATLAEHPSTVPAVLTVATVNVSGILRSAARYLGRYGWIQGAYYDGTAVVFTPAACMVGAIGMVCYGGPVDAPAQMFDQPGFDDFDATVTYLDGVLRGLFGMDVYSFNDHKGRSVGGALTALRVAADEWDRIHGGVA